MRIQSSDVRFSVRLAVASASHAQGINPYPAVPIPSVVTTCQCSSFAQLQAQGLQLRHALAREDAARLFISRIHKQRVWMV